MRKFFVLFASVLALSALSLRAFAILDTLDTLASPPPPKESIRLVAQAPHIEAKAYLLMDVNSGRILASRNIDEQLAPASLTKLMTLYLIFDSLENKRFTLNDTVNVSTKAWRMKGSRMFIKPGDKVTVEQLIHGIVTASGNDATVAMAEHIAGNENAFATLMNRQAQLLGMVHSHFTDSTGLPSTDHYVTTRGIALLSRALVLHFPQYYYFFNKKWFTYNNIKQSNRNRLLWHDASVDGLKTGHTDEAGYCLVSSAQRDDMRLLAVVMGTPSEQARTTNSQQLLNWGFNSFETHKLYKGQQAIRNVRIWGGRNKFIPFGTHRDLYVTIPRNDYRKLKVKITFNRTLEAPIQQNQKYGNIAIMLNHRVISQQPLIALRDDLKGSFLRRFADGIAATWTRLWGHDTL